VSYSRIDGPVVEVLVDHLRAFGHDVWLDQDLSGGTKWWDSILERIRACDCFVFVQSKASCWSKACLTELDYAHRLGRPILPIRVGEQFPEALLPGPLSETQYIDNEPAAKVAVAIFRSLADLPPAGPLPDPLPEPPDRPASSRDDVAAHGDGPLPVAAQRALFVELRRAHIVDRDPDAGDDLRRLRRRRDVDAVVAEEIDDLLAADRSAPRAPPSSGWRFWAAVVAVGVVLVASGSTLVAILGDYFWREPTGGEALLYTALSAALGLAGYRLGSRLPAPAPGRTAVRVGAVCCLVAAPATLYACLQAHSANASVRWSATSIVLWGLASALRSSAETRGRLGVVPDPPAGSDP
jgi:hypothetical protein